MPTVNSQVEDIHAMLPSGDQSIRVEPHTLIIWGIAGVLVNLVSDLLITRENFEIYLHRHLMEALVYAVVILTAWLIDHRMTRRLYNRRDETLSFVHRQIRKVVYLLFGLIVLYIVGVSFVGGSPINHFIAWALFGLAFFVYGLFSEKLLCWFGIFCIGMGYFCVLLNVSNTAQDYLGLSIFAIGLPVLAWLISRPLLHNTTGRRVLVSGVWLLLVIIPAVLVYQIKLSNQSGQAPDIAGIPVVTLEEFRQQTTATANQIVRLPKGTTIPLQFRLNGVTFDRMQTYTVEPLILSRSVDLVLEGEQPGSWYRIDNGDWQHQLNISYTGHSQIAPPALTQEEGTYLDFRIDVNTSN